MIENPKYTKSCYYHPDNAEVFFRRGYYRAQNWKDVESFIDQLACGIDPLEEIRASISSDICEYKGVAAVRTYDAVMDKWNKL